MNNTLAPSSACPNADTDIGDFGSTQTDKWKKIYLQSAQSRLQAMINGYNLTIGDLFNMQSLCAYEVCFIQPAIQFIIDTFLRQSLLAPPSSVNSSLQKSRRDMNMPLVSSPVVTVCTLANFVKDLGEPYHRVVGLDLLSIR